MFKTMGIGLIFLFSLSGGFRILQGYESICKVLAMMPSTDDTVTPRHFTHSRVIVAFLFV